MDNVINRILEIDQDACCRLELAEQKRKQIVNDAKLEEARIKSESIQKADTRIEKVDNFEKSVADEKISKIETEKQQKLSKLQEIYDKNHTAWEQDILNRIVGE